tara:strand:- start:515 stop:724 length:210 start_codon:yes stop_codon:yes gene_type:complete
MGKSKKIKGYVHLEKDAIKIDIRKDDGVDWNIIDLPLDKYLEYTKNKCNNCKGITLYPDEQCAKCNRIG